MVSPPISLEVLLKLADDVMTHPEVVDCTHCPEFGLGRRSRKKAGADPVVTTPTVPAKVGKTPANVGKTKKGPEAQGKKKSGKARAEFMCTKKLANGRVCGQVFDSLTGWLLSC